MAVSWRGFVAASILAGAALLPHAPLRDVVLGVGLAALLKLSLGHLRS